VIDHGFRRSSLQAGCIDPGLHVVEVPSGQGETEEDEGDETKEDQDTESKILRPPTEQAEGEQKQEGTKESADREAGGRILRPGDTEDQTGSDRQPDGSQAAGEVTDETDEASTSGETTGDHKSGEKVADKKIEEEPQPFKPEVVQSTGTSFMGFLFDFLSDPINLVITLGLVVLFVVVVLYIGLSDKQKTWLKSTLWGDSSKKAPKKGLGLVDGESPRRGPMYDIELKRRQMVETVTELRAEVSKLSERIETISKSVEAGVSDRTRLRQDLDRSLGDLDQAVARLDRRIGSTEIFDVIRYHYTEGCAETIRTLFEQSSVGLSVSASTKSEYEKNKRILNDISGILERISQGVSGVTTGRASVLGPDVEDLGRQIGKYEEVRRSIDDQKFNLMIPGDLKGPEFITYEAYKRESADIAEDGHFGYLGYLDKTYSAYMERARREIEAQIRAMTGADKTSSRGVVEFVRRDLLNIVDTVDRIVNKATGTRTSNKTEHELRKLFATLEVSEIPARIGERYSVHSHLPVKTVAGGQSPNSIVGIHRRGFLDRTGKVIRKADVIIAG
jgi:molecular chaperone GrpE (heat shock protein)